tara:strand:+ start:47 stop:526 length:480 start_codon:yes stop_codon:yes gene_type:complete
MDHSNLDDTLIGLLKKQSNDIREKNIIKLSEAKGFRKVAFDVFKDHYDGLWKLETQNGEDFLVRSSAPKYSYVDGSEGWSASSDYENRNITLFYKNIPIQRFSSQEFEFSADDVGIFKSALLESVAEDSNFIRNVLSSQPENKLEALCKTFPEINSLLK